MSNSRVMTRARTRSELATGRPRSRATRVVLNIVAVAVFVFSAFPVYWMVNSAFLTNGAIRDQTPHFLPDQPTLNNFVKVITEPAGTIEFLPALGASLLVTLSTVILAAIFGFFAALALSRFRFRTKRGLVVGLLVAQMIPAEAMIVSIFRVLDGWDLLNSVIGLTMVYLAVVLPFTIWTLRGFVAGIPVELEEAAMVDGCSRMGAFMRVTLPLLWPGLIATGVFAFIQAWNEFVFALVIMQKPEARTLPVWLRAYVQATQATDWAAIMAGSTLIAIPVIVFFLIVQGRMVSGIAAGAVKG
jgi:N,N'-diacetylchitobiose transport system permease protein